MQNEFEKQVQQKMEELKLVPSEPVWQKVEIQIRKKKDRRRLIFWIPLLALLLSGGLWIGIDRYSNNLSYNRNNNKNLNHQTQKANSVAQPDQSIIKQINDRPDEKNLKTKSTAQSGEETHSVTDIKTEDINFNSRLRNSPKKQSIQKNALERKNLIKEQEKKSSTQNNETVFTETKSEPPERITEQIKENQKPSLPDSTITNTSPDKRTDSLVAADKKDEVNASKVDSVKSDSASIKKARVKKYVTSKWKLAFGISTGVSGSGKLDVFNGFLSENKSMDYAAAPNAGSGQSNGAIYYPPSEVKKGFSFAVQAGVKKQLAKRTSFSAGLQYNYYSNSILVGNRVAQNASFGTYSVTQYFSNNRNIYNNITWQSYHNHYHFVSLPLVLDWQLLKKLPLNLSTGLSLQYLVQTNGLIFDYNKQAYFHNKNAFNHMQLFSFLGMNYSFPIRKSSITLGPELQYGISRLEKNNSNHHLYMYGLKAQLQLK